MNTEISAMSSFDKKENNSVHVDALPHSGNVLFSVSRKKETGQQSGLSDENKNGASPLIDNDSVTDKKDEESESKNNTNKTSSSRGNENPISFNGDINLDTVNGNNIKDTRSQERNVEKTVDAKNKEEEYLDILGDGSLKRKILKKAAKNAKRPKCSDLVTIKVEGKLKDGTEVDVFDSMTFVLGDGDVIKAWDLAVALMEEGQIIELLSEARFAYGEKGRKPDIPPNSFITYIIELVKKEDPLDYNSMSATGKLRYGENKRERGNFLYSFEDYASAINSYNKAIKILDPTTCSDTAENLQKLLESRLKCYNNIAACQLKIAEYDAAIKSCRMVLDVKPDNVKALFRTGKGLAAKGETKKSLVFMRKAEKLDPGNKDIKQEIIQLTKKIQAESQAERIMCQKMFGQKTLLKVDENSQGCKRMEMDFECSADVDLLEILITPEIWKMKLAYLEFYETFMTKINDMNIEMLFVGSTGEGLEKPSLTMKRDSDIDIMVTDLDYIVIERIYVRNNACCELLKLENSRCHPGYAHLRVMKNYFCDEYLRPKDFKDDIENDDLTNWISISVGRKINCKSTLHGPAVTINTKPSIFPYTDSQYEVKSMDIVGAIHCNEWPSEADEWLVRTCRSVWPTDNMITHVISMGCDLVPTGFYGSTDEDTEWRISFVRAEIYLIHLLKPAQFKTLALLRIIFKNRVFGEDFHKKICSYVAKTAFFWVSEEHDGSLWNERYCFKYLWLCLQKILHFVRNGFCPNYFMRECNVLYGKLKDFEKCHFSNRLHIFLEKSCFVDKITNLPGVKTPSGKYVSPNEICSNGLLVKDIITIIAKKSAIEELGNNIFMHLLTPSANLLKSLQKEYHLIRNVVESIPKCKQNAFLHDFLSRCISCLELRLGNILIHSMKLNQQVRLKCIMDMLSAVNINDETFSPCEKTQVAHVLFTNKLFENVLQMITPMLVHIKTSTCVRFNSIASLLKHNFFEKPLESTLIPVYNFTFLNLEEAMLPNELRLELFIARMEFEESSESFSFPFHVHINSLVYARYMEYKCYRHLDKFSESCTALQELEEEIMEDTVYQYHGLNLLGCCLCEQGRFEESMKIFALSYTKRIFRRSVLYHTAIALNRYFKGPTSELASFHGLDSIVEDIAAVENQGLVPVNDDVNNDNMMD